MLKLQYRLTSPGLVGTGSGLLKPAFEIGLSIHPLLGLPYYPGSGVKGVVRTLAETLLDNNVVSALFGDSVDEKGQASTVVFSDMLPIGCSSKSCSIYRGLVITPHYHRRGRAVPNEFYAIPNPVQHLGIEEGTVFGIISAIHPLRAKYVTDILRRSFRSSSTDICAPGGASNDPWMSYFQELCKVLQAAFQRISSANSARAVAAIIYIMLDAALSMGVGARSTKGYNIFEEYTNRLPSFSIVGYSYEPLSEEGGRTEPKSKRRSHDTRQIRYQANFFSHRRP